MAGQKGKSGRKTRIEELKLRSNVPKALKYLGTFGKDELSLNAYLQRLSRLVLEDMISPAKARSLIEAAREARQNLKQSGGPRQLADLRKMLEDAQELAADGESRASLERQHAPDGHSLGTTAADGSDPPAGGPEQAVRPNVGAAAGVRARGRRRSPR